MRRSVRNCSSTLWQSASGLVSVDGAAATDSSDRGSREGSLCAGPCCYSSKWKAQSGRLQDISALSFMLSSTVGGGGGICRCDILW